MHLVRSGAKADHLPLAAALAEHDHVVVVGSDHDPERLEALVPGVPVRVCRHLRRDIHPRHDVAALADLRRVLVQENPDVVHSCQSKANILARVAALSIRPRPATVTSMVMEVPAPEARGIGGLLGRIEHLLARSTDLYLVPGGRMADSLPSHAEERIATMRVVVPLPAPAHGVTDRNHLVHVGALSERKRPVEVVRLVGLLETLTGQRWQVTFLGDGPLRPAIVAEAAALGLDDRITLAGYVEDVASYLQPGRVVVLLSTAEGLPQVLVQAAAANVPFVSTDVSGVEELLDLGATGSIVAHGDLVAAALAVIRMNALPAVPGGFSPEPWTAPSVYDAYRLAFDRLSAGRSRHCGAASAARGEG